MILRLIQTTLIEFLFTGGDIQCWIGGEEVAWFQGDGDDLHWHDGEVFDSWSMCKTEGVPYYVIFVFDIGLGLFGNEGFDSCAATGLVGELATAVEFPILVFGDPNGVVGELRSAGVVTVWTR